MPDDPRSPAGSEPDPEEPAAPADADEIVPAPVEEAAPPPKKKHSKRWAQAAEVATAVIQHRQMLVAAMEMLRAKNVLTEEEEVRLMATYEQGANVAKSAVSDMIEKLQKANLGQVFIDLTHQFEGKDASPEGLRAMARPYIDAAKQEFRKEALPFIEQAKQRLAELKVLEEPTLRRLEAIGENLRLAGKEVAVGLKGAGREAADELVRRGKRWWMSAETEEMEREVFDWVLRTLPKAEASLVRVLVGSGILFLVAGILVAARQITLLERLAVFASIFLLIFLGFVFINWGIKLHEAMKAGRGEIEALARMTPQERRLTLARRWTQRAQAEGVIDSTEAATVIEQTLRAAPEDPLPSGPSGRAGSPPS